jgi:hypothetical protein
MRTTTILPTAISVLALFVALGGTGYALVNSSQSETVIHACVNNKTGAVRITGGSHACQRPRHGRAGERALDWNQTSPSGAYYASRRNDRSGDASVTVPPGDYIAFGGCTAELTQTADSTVPAFGIALAALTTDPNFWVDGAPAMETRASVPNAGYRAGGGTPFGSASLYNSTGFQFPHGGTIYETCFPDPGSHGNGGSSLPLTFTSPYVTAIRVGSLHQR